MALFPAERYSPRDVETIQPRFAPFRGIEFPRFNGENPRAWIDKANKYFQVISTIPEDKKVDLAAYVYFDGEAKIWCMKYMEERGTPTWDDFITMLLKKFELNEVNSEQVMKVCEEPCVLENMPASFFNKTPLVDEVLVKKLTEIEVTEIAIKVFEKIHVKKFKELKKDIGDEMFDKMPNPKLSQLRKKESGVMVFDEMLVTRFQEPNKYAMKELEKLGEKFNNFILNNFIHCYRDAIDNDITITMVRKDRKKEGIEENRDQTYNIEGDSYLHYECRWGTTTFVIDPGGHRVYKMATEITKYLMSTQSQPDAKVGNETIFCKSVILSNYRYKTLPRITNYRADKNAKGGYFLNGMNQIAFLRSWYNGIGYLSIVSESWTIKEFNLPFDHLRCFLSSTKLHYCIFREIAGRIFIFTMALVSSRCNENVNMISWMVLILVREIIETENGQLVRLIIQDTLVNVVQKRTRSISLVYELKENFESDIWLDCSGSINTRETPCKSWIIVVFIETSDRACDLLSSVKLHILHLTRVASLRIGILVSYFPLTDITKFTSPRIACLKSMLNISFQMEQTNLRSKALGTRDIGGLKYRVISTNDGLEISCVTIVMSISMHVCSHHVCYCFIRAMGSAILCINLELSLRLHLDIHSKNSINNLDDNIYKPIESGRKHVLLIQERPTCLITNIQQPYARIFDSLASVIVNEVGVWRKNHNTKMIHLLLFWVLAYINPKYAEAANWKVPQLFLIQGLCLRIKRSAISFPTQGYKDFGPSSSSPTPYLLDILNSLIITIGRTNRNDSKLRTSSYETFNEVVRCSNLPETSQIIIKLLTAVMFKLEETLHLQILSFGDMEKEWDLQASPCGVIQVIIQKLSSVDETKADQNMLLFLNVFACYSATVHEEAMLSIGALAYATGLDFGRHLHEFYKYLEMGLQNFEECHVCVILIEVAGDICRTLEDKILPYCDGIMAFLLKDLSSDEMHRSVKPPIFFCFGYIDLAIGEQFEKNNGYALLVHIALEVVVFCIMYEFSHSCLESGILLTYELNFKNCDSGSLRTRIFQRGRNVMTRKYEKGYIWNIPKTIGGDLKE